MFLAGNRFRQRVAAGDSLVIGELGFGTGLNFLAAWAEFEDAAPSTARLHYVACEQRPMAPDDIGHALRRWPELESRTDQLVEVYPRWPFGVHRLHFAKRRITLTLLFGDVVDAWRRYRGSVDMWFLDGFAPDKNIRMWSPAAMAAVAEHSRPGTSASTYTAAGDVRRGLAAAGFEVDRVAGFGGKRHMTQAVFRADPEPRPSWKAAPWYRSSRPPAAAPRTAVVVGAGLAGTAVAYELAARDWQVTLIERAGEVATGASGNPLGLVMPMLTRQPAMQSRFSLAACAAVARHWLELPGLAGGGAEPTLGVIELAWSEEERERLQMALDAFPLPPDVAHWLEADEVARLAGIPVEVGGLWFPQATAISPGDLCRQRLEAQGQRIRLLTSSPVSGIERAGDQWRVLGDGDQELAVADIVVLANAERATDIDLCAWLPLRIIRGQIASVRATATSEGLRLPLVYKGYLLPAVDGRHVLGATYAQGDDELDLHPEDHEQLVRDCAETFPALAAEAEEQWRGAVHGRAALRTMTPDNLPVVGPVPRLAAFRRHYAGLRHGRRDIDYPDAENHPGLYLSVGHGSRGLSTTQLAAELLAAQINGEPLPLESDLVDSVNPARFIIRDIKRGRNSP